MDRSENVKSRLFALIPLLAGLFIIGVALWGDEAGMQAPRWVVAAAGGVFLMAGLAILGQDLPWFSAVAGALLVTMFGAVGSWVAFGAGERQFSSSLSLPFVSITGPASELTGRLCFAPGAILLDALAIYLWLRLLAGKIR